MGGFAIRSVGCRLFPMDSLFRVAASQMCARALAQRLLLLLIVLLAPLASGTEQSLTSQGQTCLVCGKGIEEEGVEVAMKGRRVYLHKGACQEEWLANADAYFSQLQPKAALWDESGAAHGVLLGGWFWFGLYVLAGLIFGALSAYGAINRGLNAGHWFFAGLLFNVFALVALLTRGKFETGNVPKGLSKVALTHQPVPCPACPAENHPSASHCSRCGSVLDPTHSSETERC